MHEVDAESPAQDEVNHFTLEFRLNELVSMSHPPNPSLFPLFNMRTEVHAGYMNVCPYTYAGALNEHFHTHAGTDTNQLGEQCVHTRLTISIHPHICPKIPARNAADCCSISSGGMGLGFSAACVRPSFAYFLSPRTGRKHGASFCLDNASNPSPVSG